MRTNLSDQPRLTKTLAVSMGNAAPSRGTIEPAHDTRFSPLACVFLIALFSMATWAVVWAIGELAYCWGRTL
jgi:hypothetical protein